MTNGEEERPPQADTHDQPDPLTSKAQGYFTLACIVLGMILVGIYGPNDIWTSLLVGAVFGGVVSQPLFRLFIRLGGWIGTPTR